MKDFILVMGLPVYFKDSVGDAMKKKVKDIVVKIIVNGDYYHYLEGNDRHSSLIGRIAKVLEEYDLGGLDEAANIKNDMRMDLDKVIQVEKFQDMEIDRTDRLIKEEMARYWSQEGMRITNLNFNDMENKESTVVQEVKIMENSLMRFSENLDALERAVVFFRGPIMAKPMKEDEVLLPSVSSSLCSSLVNINGSLRERLEKMEMLVNLLAKQFES